MDNKQSEEIAVRHLGAWLIGAASGAYFGAWVGSHVPASLALLTGGVIGWLVGGMLGPLLFSLIVRSTPRWTVSNRTASLMIFGSLVGALVIGAFSSMFGAPPIMALVTGGVIGMATGYFIGSRV